MSAHNIASKFRRALRNGTGATFTQEQLQELGHYGVLRLLAEIEAIKAYRDARGEPHVLPFA